MTHSFEHALLVQIADHLATAAAKRSLRYRKQFIELIFADAKVRHGMQRAQRRGRVNMLIQATLTAAVMNIRKLARFGLRTGTGMAVGMSPRSPLRTMSHDSGLSLRLTFHVGRRLATGSHDQRITGLRQQPASRD